MVPRQQILAHLFNNLIFKNKDELVIEVATLHYTDSHCVD